MKTLNFKRSKSSTYDDGNGNVNVTFNSTNSPILDPSQLQRLRRQERERDSSKHNKNYDGHHDHNILSSWGHSRGRSVGKPATSRGTSKSDPKNPSNSRSRSHSNQPRPDSNQMRGVGVTGRGFPKLISRHSHGSSHSKEQDSRKERVGSIGKKMLSSSGADCDEATNRRSRSLFRRGNSNNGNDQKQKTAPSSSSSKNNHAIKSPPSLMKSNHEVTDNNTNTILDDAKTKKSRRSYSVPMLSINTGTTGPTSASTSDYNSNAKSNSNEAHQGHLYGPFDFGTVTVVATNSGSNSSGRTSKCKSEFQRKCSNGTHDTNPLSVASSDSSLDKSGKSSNSDHVHSILDESDRSDNTSTSGASSKSRGSRKSHGTAPIVSTVVTSSTPKTSSSTCTSTTTKGTSRNRGTSITRSPTDKKSRSKVSRSVSIQRRRSSSNRIPVLQPPLSPTATRSVYSGINRHGVVIRKDLDESDEVVVPEEDNDDYDKGRNAVSRQSKRDPEETGSAERHHRVGNANNYAKSNCSSNNSVKCVLCMKEIVKTERNSGKHHPKSNANSIQTVGKFHYHAECLRKSRGANSHINDLVRMTQADLKKGSNSGNGNSNCGSDKQRIGSQAEHKNAKIDNESSQGNGPPHRSVGTDSRNNRTSENSIDSALFRDSATVDTPVNNYYISPDYVIDSSCRHDNNGEDNGGSNHPGRRGQCVAKDLNDFNEDDCKGNRATTNDGRSDNNFSYSIDESTFGTNPHLCRFYREQIVSLRTNDPNLRQLSLRITTGMGASKLGPPLSDEHAASEKTKEKDSVNISSMLSLKAWERIGFYVARNDQLHVIDFSNHDNTDGNSAPSDHVGDEEMSVFFNAACRNESVRILNLSNNAFGVNGITALASFLKRNKRLETLNMSGCTTIQNEGFKLLIEALHNSSIRDLNLSHCDISNISALKNISLPNLMHLRLSSNSIGLDGCKTLSNWLRSSDSNELRTLCLQNCHINDDGAKVLSLALSRNTTITHLHLTGNAIESQGRAAFLKLICDMANIERVFKSNHILKYIYLDESTTTSKTSDYLQEALDINRSFDGDARTACLAKVKTFHKNKIAMLQDENKEKGEKIKQLMAKTATFRTAGDGAEKMQHEYASTTARKDLQRELEDLRAQNKALSEHNIKMEKKFQHLSDAVEGVSLATTQNMIIEKELLEEIVELKAIVAELNDENEDLMNENQQLIDLLSEKDRQISRLRGHPWTPIGFTNESHDEDDDDFWDDMSDYTTSTFSS
ncbi:hypothetical protein ACHAXS_006134 [Conticribra weissflogii]